jgi:hypothetical protein
VRSRAQEIKDSGADQLLVGVDRRDHFSYIIYRTLGPRHKWGTSFQTEPEALGESTSPFFHFGDAEASHPYPPLIRPFIAATCCGFVIALHSPDGVVETGLRVCPPEKSAGKLARGVKRDTFSGPVSEQKLGNCGDFARFSEQGSRISLQPRLCGGARWIRTLDTTFNYATKSPCVSGLAGFYFRNERTRETNRLGRRIK